MCDETPSMKIKVLDVSDLNNISVSSTFSAESYEQALPHNAIFVDNIAYVSYYNDGLQVFDISAFARTLRNSSENRFERASRASHATEGSQKIIVWSFRAPELSPKPLWDALENLQGLCDLFGRRLCP